MEHGKICAACKKQKPLDQFTFRDSSKKVYQASCRECTRQQSRQYYQRTKKAHIERAVLNNRKKQLDFLLWKKTLRCTCCGEDTSACLEFHHPNGDKAFNVSSAAYTVGEQRFHAEVSKCVVLCSNCHKKVHAGVLCILPNPDHQ